MNHLLAKVKGTENQFFKIISQDDAFFDMPTWTNALDYTPNYKLEEDEWYRIIQFSTLGYSNSLLGETINSTNYNQLPESKYNDIVYFCSQQTTYLLFQKMVASQKLQKKWFQISNAPQLENNKPIIILNPHVDAVYDASSDILYFKELAKLKVIFHGIDELYREATHQEVEKFLSQKFISLNDNYSATEVGSANRKRITTAIDTITQYSEQEQSDIFKYIHDYCSDIPTENNAFKISNEEQLKKVLYGIEQRYYTTQIGNEKRVANSIHKIDQNP